MTLLKTIYDILVTNSMKCFNNLFKDYNALVNSVARKFTGNSADINDLSADIWAKIYSSVNAGRLQEDKNITAWISTIARNHCIDWTRKKRETISLENIEEQGINEIERNIIEKEKYKFLKDALSSMPEQERILLILHHIDGMPIKALSKKFRLSKSAIKVRLYRAREKLRDTLKNLGYFNFSL